MPRNECDHKLVSKKKNNCTSQIVLSITESWTLEKSWLTRTAKVCFVSCFSTERTVSSFVTLHSIKAAKEEIHSSQITLSKKYAELLASLLEHSPKANTALKTDSFDCDAPALNEYLCKYARQNHVKGLAKTFVSVDEKDCVLGYYTLFC